MQNLTIKLIVRVRDTRTRSNLTPYAYDTRTGIAYRYAYKIKFLHELRADKIILIVYSVTQKRKCNLIVPVRDTGTRIKYRYAIPVRYRYAVRVRVRLTYRNLTTRMRLNFANPIEIQNTKIRIRVLESTSEFSKRFPKSTRNHRHLSTC